MNKKQTGSTNLLLIINLVVLLIPALFKNKNTTIDDSKPSKVNTENQENTETKIITPKNNNATNNDKTETPDSVIDTKETSNEDPTVSVYKNKIIVSSISGGSSNPQKEYIVLRNKSSKEKINITDFKIETREYQTYTIPKGHELPGFGAIMQDDIILNPQEEARIYVGTQERKINFKENICTGYFDQYSDFGGVLTHDCPKIDTIGMLNFSDGCRDTLRLMPKCKMPDTKTYLDHTCNDFINTHYSYIGCVKDFKERSNFYKNRWHVWMQKTTNFFRDRYETITIRDKEGKIVQTYSY